MGESWLRLAGAGTTARSTPTEARLVAVTESAGFSGDQQCSGGAGSSQPAGGIALVCFSGAAMVGSCEEMLAELAG